MSLLAETREAVKKRGASSISPKVFSVKTENTQMQCGGRYARYPKKV